MRLLLKNWVLNCKTGIMKKIIYILFGMLAWWSCEDENSLIGPEGVFSEYTDSRDGKIYRCVTIGDQTWMAENLPILWYSKELNMIRERKPHPSPF